MLVSNANQNCVIKALHLFTRAQLHVIVVTHAGWWSLTLAGIQPMTYRRRIGLSELGSGVMLVCTGWCPQVVCMPMHKFVIKR